MHAEATHTSLRDTMLFAIVAFATTLHLQILATCQATTWLVETSPVAGYPLSVSSQAFHQSNFAILAICSHTLAGCVL